MRGFMKKNLILCSLLLSIAFNSQGTFDSCNDSEMVFGCDDVFSAYYQDITSKFGKCIDYDEFIEKYYESNLTIDVYTNSIIENNGFYKQRERKVIPLKSSYSSSSDESYIIRDYDARTYKTTYSVSCFQRLPIYKDIYNYSFINQYDILDETFTIGNDVGHTAIVTDKCKKIDNGITFIETEEAVAGGVQHGFLDDERIAKFGINIYRYRSTISSSAKLKIKKFLEEQLLDEYSLLGIPNGSLDYYNDLWMCTQLVVAAYNYAGIHITPSTTYLPIAIEENDGILSLITSFAPNHVHISISDYSFGFLGINSYYEISVYNSSSNTIGVYYNSKMCFENHARNWSGLSDVNKSPITIPKYSSKKFKVYTNFAADAVAFSVMYKNKRMITCADRLSSSEKTLCQRFIY